MGIRESVKKATSSAAGIAAATTGLSTCHDGGGIVVDPVPPPLICSTVSGGQSFVMSATRSANTVTVKIKQNNHLADFWTVSRVGDVIGAALTGTLLPQYGHDSLVVTLELESSNTSLVDFTVEGRMEDSFDHACTIRRTVHVTIGPTSVEVSEANLDQLPLRARNSAQIVMLHQSGSAVQLEARSGFAGPVAARWEVTGGSLSDIEGLTARWTLPAEPGLYQAEVMLDYGPDGMAFDALVLEVRG